MKYKVGQFVEVVDRECGHNFPIGSVVKIIKSKVTMIHSYRCKLHNETYFLHEDEIKPTEVKGFFTPQNL